MDGGMQDGDGNVGYEPMSNAPILSRRMHEGSAAEGGGGGGENRRGEEEDIYPFSSLFPHRRISSFASVVDSNSGNF